MQKARITEADSGEHVCCVCGRSGKGYGFNPSHSRDKEVWVAETAWVCDDPDCITLARGAYVRLQRDFDRREDRAASAGGRAAGRWLRRTCFTTDLAELNHNQFSEFCRRVVSAYRAALKLDASDYNTGGGGS